MNDMLERYNKIIKAIAKAGSEGKDTGKWQELLLLLIEKAISNNTIKVRYGRFGFCTCSIDDMGVCTGCVRIKEACSCKEHEVYPGEELTKKYAFNRRRVKK